MAANAGLVLLAPLPEPPAASLSGSGLVLVRMALALLAGLDRALAAPGLLGELRCETPELAFEMLDACWSPSLI